jgi:lipid A 3-O-deacylase
LIRSAKYFLLLLTLVVLAPALHSVAESPDADSAPKHDGDNPVSEVRSAQSWEYGPFINWGKGVGDRSDFNFLWGGAQIGKVMTPVIHAGFLSGQFEYGVNITPLWLAFTPAAHTQTFLFQGQVYNQPIGGGTYTGVSLTPVIFRWNFATHSRRIQPWFQAAGGLIYTTHKFPPDVLVDHGTAGGTSVWNFSPQGGVGLHYFLRSKRSIDVGLNAVHISSASLGDRNPGVNASLQLQVGYTFWK